MKQKRCGVSVTILLILEAHEKLYLVKISTEAKIKEGKGVNYFKVLGREQSNIHVIKQPNYRKQERFVCIKRADTCTVISLARGRLLGRIRYIDFNRNRKMLN